MNTSGMMRGYMSKNMKGEQFMQVVVGALSKEFDCNVKLVGIDNRFKITMKNYEVIMSRDVIDKLQSPYAVDRFLLQQFQKQGFKFDRNRSQYIQYCFGIFNDKS